METIIKVNTLLVACIKEWYSNHTDMSKKEFDNMLVSCKDQVIMWDMGIRNERINPITRVVLKDIDYTLVLLKDRRKVGQDIVAQLLSAAAMAEINQK